MEGLGTMLPPPRLRLHDTDSRATSLSFRSKVRWPLLIKAH